MESLIDGLDDGTTAPGSLGNGPSAKTRAERAEKDERRVQQLMLRTSEPAA